VQAAGPALALPLVPFPPLPLVPCPPPPPVPCLPPLPAVPAAAGLAAVTGTSHSLARESGDRRIEVDAKSTLGGLSRLLADPDAALEHYRDALRLASEAGYRHGEAGYRHGEAVALIGLARTQADLGRHADALATIDQALRTTRQTGLRVLEGHA
jgi:tetratricopeptide (TPR) repeat protein